jgi:2-C-methyl-D-erythritol 4-phosphate cytidylyltransferase
MLVERIGGRVEIHPSPPENMKVTTPLDLRVAALLLAGRAGS